MLKIINFERNYEIFTQKIEISVNLFTQYWNELLQQNCDLQKLRSTGIKMIPSIKMVKLQYGIIMKNCDSQLCQMKVMEKYAYYLKYIVNENNESEKILNRIQFLQQNQHNLNSKKKIYNNNQENFSLDQDQSNLNTLVIQMSGNLKTFCQVTRSNQQITRLLGYTRDEVLNQNISLLMTKDMAEYHDQYILTYIEKTTMQSQEQKLVFPIDKQGYTIPCISQTKILPNLDEGLQFIGLIKEIDFYHCAPYNKIDYTQRYTNHYLIYNANDLLISCCTNSCYQFFGIDQLLTNLNSQNASQFTIDMIIPEITDQKIQQQLKQTSLNDDSQGVVMNLNTLNIQNEFLISQENVNIIQEQSNYNESSDLININNNQDNIKQAIYQQSNDINNQKPAISQIQNDGSQYKQQLNYNNITNKQQTNSSSQEIDFNSLEKTQNTVIVQQNYNDNEKDNNNDKQKKLDQKQYKDLESIDKEINKEYRSYLQQKYRETQIKVFLIQQIQGLNIIKFWDLNEPIKNDPSLVTNEKFESKSDLIIKNKIKNLQQQNQVGKKIYNSNSDVDSMENGVLPEYKIDKIKPSGKNSQKRSTLLQLSQNVSSLSQKEQELINNSKEKSNSEEKKRKQIQREVKNIKHSLEIQKENYLIKNIFKWSVFLIICIFIIVSVQYSQKILEINDLEGSIDAVNTVFYRSTLIPRAGYYSRNIYNDSNGFSFIAPIYLDDGVTINEQAMLAQRQGRLKANQNTLREIANEMHEYQFKVIEQISFLSSIDQDNIKLEKHQLKFLQSDKTYVIDQLEIQDAMLLLVSAMSALESAELDSLLEKEDVQLNEMQLFFDYLNNQGIYYIRHYNDLLSDQFKEAYIDYINSFQFISYLLRIICVLLGVCFFILLPYIWKAQQHNIEVIVAFSYIDEQYLQQFVQNCKKYTKLYLDDKKYLCFKNNEIIVNQSQQNLNIDNQQNTLNKNNNKNSVSTVDLSQINNNNNEISMQQLNIDQSRQELFENEEKLFQKKVNINDLNKDNNAQIQQNIQIKNEEYEYEQNTEKQEQLIRQNNYSKCSLLVKFLVFFLIFVGYFIFDQTIKDDFSKQIEISIEHTKLISRRQSIVLYLLIFIREEIITNSPKSFKYIDNQEYFTQNFNEKDTLIYEFSEHLYESEMKIKEQIDKDFPSSFDGYLELIKQYEEQNPCELFQQQFGDEWFMPNLEFCEGVADGVIKDGINQTMTVLNERARTFVRNYREVREQLGGTLNKQQIFGYVNNPDYIDLLYIYVAQRDAIGLFIEEFKKNFLVYMTDQQVLQEWMYGVLVSFLSIIYICIWIPFIYMLRQKVQITTQMVNLIPVNIIQMNVNIKSSLEKLKIISHIKN